jgi:hypothetical protein
LHAWFIEYQSTPNADSSDRDGRFVHRIVAAIGPDRFYHWGAHGTDRYGWSDDPYQQRLIISGPSAVIEFPAIRSFHEFTMKPPDPLPGTAPQELIFVALGLWPFPSRPAPHLADGTPCDLREVAASAAYHLAPKQQTVNGRSCYILENPGHDRLWLDLDRGSALLAREFYDPQSGTRLQRIELTDHREIAPGIFFPMRWRNIIDDPQAPVDASITVLDVRLNDAVPASLFEFHPQAGSVRVFDDGHFQQAAPGGTDYLDKLVAWIKEQSPPAASPPMPSEAAAEDAVCAAGAVACAVLFWRRRRPA